MKITKRIIVALVIMAFAVSQIAFASTETLPVIYTGQVIANENPDKPDVYIDSDFVLRISANLKDGLKGQLLAATVLKTVNQGTESENTVAIYTSQETSTASDCKVTFASFEFPANYESGKYTVVISGQGITKEKSKTVDVYFYGASAVKSALSQVVAADGENIYQAFEYIPYGDGTTNADILKADYNKITYLSQESKNVFQKMLDAGDSYFSQIDSLNVSENSYEIMSLASEFIRLYESSLCIASYYDAKDAAAIKAWFELNQDDNNPMYDFNGDSAANSEYLKQSSALHVYLKLLEDTDREDNGNRAVSLYTELAQSKVVFSESSLGTWDSTLNEMIVKITDNLRHQIILTTVQHMTTGIIRKMFEDEHISKLFASDIMSGYASLSEEKKSEFFSRICGKGYESFDLFSNACGQIITELSAGAGAVITPGGNSGSGSLAGGNSASGGFSGGGGGSFAVSGEPKRNETTGKAFNDLEGALWAQDAIEALYDKGVVSGKSEGVFDPTSGVTRSEFVKMIVSAFGFNTEGFECEFTDLNKDMWQYKYIASAYKFGIVNGYTDGSFGINSTITRQDMAVIMERALRTYGKTLSYGSMYFTDNSSISGYAFDAVSALSGAGIITGMPDGSFAPKDSVTRAQAAVVIYRAIK